jgi:Flp pilus assembly protein TadD
MRLNAEALPAMQQAAALLPDDVEAQCNLGNTLKDLGNLDKAEASYRRSLKARPDYAPAHHNPGVTRVVTGRREKTEPD